MLCIMTILTILLNVDPITDKIIAFINHPNINNIEAYNAYYKNNNYTFVSNTNNFTPYSKQEHLNIIYTIINSGTDIFTFYCPKE